VWIALTEMGPVSVDGESIAWRVISGTGPADQPDSGQNMRIAGTATINTRTCNGRPSRQ